MFERTNAPASPTTTQQLEDTNEEPIDDNDAEQDYVDVESLEEGAVPNKMIKISSQELNNPADFMSSVCFDSMGRLLSREECEVGQLLERFLVHSFNINHIPI